MSKIAEVVCSVSGVPCHILRCSNITVSMTISGSRATALSEEGNSRSGTKAGWEAAHALGTTDEFQSAWVNYNDLTAAEPWESLLNKGNLPFLWPNYSG